jgi:DNA-binding beta-propeller fold protein YncE
VNWRVLLQILSLLFCSFTVMGVAQMSKPDAAKPLLLVVNQGDFTLSLIDPDGGQELAKIHTHGIHAHEVAVSADGRLAYLPIYGNSVVGAPGTDGRTIEVVDLGKRSVVDTIELNSPTRPHCAKFGPDGMLYVSAELEQAVDIVDPQARKVVGSVPTGEPQSHMFVISHDGKRAYTSNVSTGTVSVLDLAARKTIKVISVAKSDQRISISNDDRYVFTADQDQPRLAVIDTAKNEVTQWIALPGIGYGTAATRDGRWLLVTLSKLNQVAVVDLAQMKVVKTIDVAPDPVQILMRPDRPLAYVSCSAKGKVAVVDLKTWEVSQTLTAGPGADGLGWAAGQ